MKTRLTIRVAALDDLDKLVTLDQPQMLEPLPWNPWPSIAQRHTFIRKSIAQGTCSIAMIEEQPVGFVILDYTFYENGFISLVYVAEEHRRSGIGTALVQHAEQTCLTAKLFTSTNASNTAMQGLLLRQGYEPSGVVENLDEGDPELLFFKRVLR